MAKLTKFKAQQVEFGTHYKIEETNRGDTKIKSITPAFGNIRELGTPETEEIYNGLQLGNVHTLQAIKSTNLNIDYYICNLDGLTEFGLNNDLKLRITVDNANTNTTTKLRLNNVDYTLLKEHNGTLKQIEAGDFKPNKSYELVFNGSQFVVINIMEYGTTAGTALEGNRLAEIIGMEFGGNIQDTGNKTKGKFYFDSVTKFYYECIADTNLTYNDATKFRAISNKPLSDKVEGLLEVGNNYLKFSNGIILGFGTCIASPSGTMNNYGINMGGITSLILTVNGGTYIASGETANGTTFKARTNAPGNVSASYLAIGKWK
ncbi:MAG: hypothetical protein ACFNUP_00450 [Leptotrichia hofstadii]